MPFDLSIVGRPSEPAVFEYGWKDVVLYALGIGARVDELDYLFEGRGPKVYPSFAVVPSFEPMIKLLMKSGGNLAMVVHGAQKVVMHAPIPAQGVMKTVGTIRGIYDMKKFAQAIVDTTTTDGDGNKLFDTTWSIIFRGSGNFGGSPPPRPNPEDAIIIPSRDPDFLREESTSREQALLYRLSGDFNPLHADPEFAALAGFTQGPILHGLCTFGHMVRAAVIGACGGDASRVRSFEGQFRKPVWPGDTIVTSGWKLDVGNKYALSVSVKERPDPVITNASVVIA
jgi:acyl dehydratase